VLKADNLHHSVPLSRNLVALTSWNPLGLSRPVMGQIYLFIYRLEDRGIGVRLRVGSDIFDYPIVYTDSAV